ncbi:general transcription factor II-I repeat domain-containing protein 2A-like [Oratosquilla oratoria]|uniref:general transcription factor II-I repeat domain-containing protein 2A-like n=1 Tax=Oratosquilla oratoria TaxID=337810 RepID=UPI003F757B0D
MVLNVLKKAHVELLVFIPGVDSEFNVTQELASVHSMHTTTTGEDIFNEVSKTMTEYYLEWKQVQCVTVDEGKNMSGTKKGLVGQITTACEVGGFSKPIFLHCLIHQQALCLKYVDMSCVLKPVVSVVNFIRSHALDHRQFRDFYALNHRQFRDFLKEIDAEFVDLPYYYSNMTGHMNQLNLKLQGKTNLINDYFVHVKAFRAKLVLLEGQADDRLKDKYREGNLIEFYKCLMPDQFPNLKKFACSLVSIFGTTYLCEQTFSKMKYVKSNYRANLSDDHLKSILTIGSSNLEPDFNEILKSKRQYHASH